MIPEINKQQFNAAMTVLAAVADQNNQEKPEEYITYAEAKRITGYSRWTLLRWIKDGRIVAEKQGAAKAGSIRILKSSLLAYLAFCKIEPENKGKEVK